MLYIGTCYELHIHITNREINVDDRLKFLNDVTGSKLDCAYQKSLWSLVQTLEENEKYLFIFKVDFEKMCD